MNGTTTFLIIETISSALTVTGIPFMMYFKHLYNEEATTLATWIQGLRNNIL